MTLITWAIYENENTENDKNNENKKHSIPTYKGLLIDDIIHDNIPEDVSRDISQPVYFKAELGGLMDIEICDDSGSSISMINTKILKKMTVYRKGSLKDFQVQVANGNVNKKTEYALVELAHRDHRELVAYVISKNLPCDALIGRATKRRLGITYDSELNQVFWRGDKLTTPDETYSDSVGATFLTNQER